MDSICERDSYARTRIHYPQGLFEVDTCVRARHAAFWIHLHEPEVGDRPGQDAVQVAETEDQTIASNGWTDWRGAARPDVANDLS